MGLAKKYYVLIIAVNSLLLAIGIALVGASIAKYNNAWPLMTIFMHTLAIVFPTMCTRCDHAEYGNHILDDASDTENSALELPWVFFGLMVIVGYAVPVELFRSHQLDLAAVYLTVAGGTTILLAILIYVKLIYFSKTD